MPPRGRSTARSRAASRKNGKAGAKHGKKGGRPAAALSSELLERLGDPPYDDTLKLIRWYSTAIAMVTRQRLAGVKGAGELAKDAKGLAAVAAKLLAPDAVFEAHRRLLENEKDLANSDGGGELEDMEDDE